MVQVLVPSPQNRLVAQLRSNDGFNKTRTYVLETLTCNLNLSKFQNQPTLILTFYYPKFMFMGEVWNRQISNLGWKEYCFYDQMPKYGWSCFKEVNHQLFIPLKGGIEYRPMLGQFLTLMKNLGFWFYKINQNPIPYSLLLTINK